MKSPLCATRCRVVRLLPALLFATLLQSCAKDGLNVSQSRVPAANSTPLLIPPIHPITSQQPFQAYITTYDVPLTSNDEALFLGTGGLDYNSNAEIGFVFRSSVAGTVIGLGILLPTTGFTHTVTLWDSATQAVLATIAVTNKSAAAFTYAALTTTVPIQANHPYIVGYNTLAIGNANGISSPGNWIYSVQGLFVDGGQGSDLPLLPFREGNITVENAFYNNYGTGRVPANLFPPTTCWNDEPNGFLGTCDLEFAIPI